MASKSWTEQAVDEFFAERKAPTQRQCDELSLAISGASTLRMVDIPGSLSYTVVCAAEDGHGAQDDGGRKFEVVSFREPDSGLDDGLIKLAKAVHGHLVPDVSYHGVVEDSEPPLGIYTMPLLPGTACIKALRYEVDLDPDEEAKHICFITHLARYFARCWMAPQPVKPSELALQEADIASRLSALRTAQLPVIPDPTLAKLETTLSLLYAADYPQVLVHGDLSLTNILVDPTTCAITGLVDWSLATVRPFGMELHCLFMMTGFMDMTGWHDYTCRNRLIDAFWEEFWHVLSDKADGYDAQQRTEIRTMAENAANIGAIMCYAFQRNSDGSPSKEFATSENMLGYLKAWLGD